MVVAVWACCEPMFGLVEAGAELVEAGAFLVDLADPFRQEWAEFVADVRAGVVFHRPEVLADFVERQTEFFARFDQVEPPSTAAS